MRRQSKEEGTKLVDFIQGLPDYNVKMPKPLQDLSWLTQQSQIHIAKEELSPPPPPKKKKENRSEFEKRVFSQRTAGKGSLKNHQMGKASKKVWDLDMAYIRSVFAYLTVWLNPIGIKAKIGKYVNICMVS